MKRPARVTIQRVERVTCPATGLPMWEVTFGITVDESNAARTNIQILASPTAETSDVASQAWQVFVRVSQVVSQAHNNIDADTDRLA